MIKKFKQRLADRRKVVNDRLKADGYSYAAGQLLNTDGAAMEMLGYQADGLDRNSFDEGIVDALNDYALQQGIIENEATPTKQMEQELFELKNRSLGIKTPFEIQSGSTRLNHAEGLILQLPPTHEGRNTWLLNYGVLMEAQAFRFARGYPMDEVPLRNV